VTPNWPPHRASSGEEAIAWAARIAKACRCDQEVRVFGFDPESKWRTEMAGQCGLAIHQATPLRGSAEFMR
jgi:hypothetical protein